MNILITMAEPATRPIKGLTAGPLYAHQISGKSLLEWSLLSLENFYSERFIFLPLKSHKSEVLIRNVCAELGIKNIAIKEITATTKGQAATAHSAKEIIKDPREPLVIFGPYANIFSSELNPRMTQGDGWMPCIRKTGRSLISISFDPSLRVVDVSDQQRLSEFSALGFFYWRSFELFEHCRRLCPYIGFKEHSVPPLYPLLAESTSKSVFTHIVSLAAVHPFKDSTEIAEFTSWAKQ